MPIKAVFLFLILNLWSSNVSAQTTWSNPDKLNMDTLNKYILQEVNLLRKKAKVDPLVNQELLLPAAEDHADYMLDKEKTTHKQSFNSKKKWPKNRVDFYGQQFDVVGENVQQWDLGIEMKFKGERSEQKVATYERLAKALVLNWKNSKGHYLNMISEDYTSTYVSVKMNDDGQVYACQLFGSNPYTIPEEAQVPEYKPDRPKKCRRCSYSPGWVSITEDSLIVLEIGYKAFGRFKGILPRLSMFRRNADGFAADIVLKDQYSCDTSNVYNGMLGVDGIPLEPVYKKDFRKGGNKYGLTYARIILGKVPGYIDEEFEVNLTTINNKRTCTMTMYHIIPAYFDVRPSLDLKLDTLSAETEIRYTDILSENIIYEQDDATISDSLIQPILDLLNENNKTVTKAEVSGYASVEGSTENNLKLHKKRAENILEHLDEYGVTSDNVSVKTAENFAQFRQDVKGTEFEELGNLSNDELKKKLLDKNLILQLEPILKNHRYAELKLFVEWFETIEYDLDTVQYLFSEAVKKERFAEMKKMQSLQFKFASEGELTVDDLYEVDIPKESRDIPILYNRFVMHFYLDSLVDHQFALTSLSDSLKTLLELDESDKLLNTQQLIVEFELKNRYTGFGGQIGMREYMDELKKRKNIDSKIHARLILKLASINDWSWWRWKGYSAQDKFMYKEVKKYVKQARLPVEETFQIARYYCFFHQNKYAYSLTKGLIDDTDDPENIIFFLKLIHLTDAYPPRNTYLRLFKKARELAGPEFCEFFNSPRLNFQIFKDEEVKAIYCEACADYQPQLK